jgi:hypothetical protein
MGGVAATITLRRFGRQKEFAFLAAFGRQLDRLHGFQLGAGFLGGLRGHGFFLWLSDVSDFR